MSGYHIYTPTQSGKHYSNAKHLKHFPQKHTYTRNQSSILTKIINRKITYQYYFYHAVFQYLKEVYETDEDKHFSRAYCNRTRGNGFKLEESQFRLNV